MTLPLDADEARRLLAELTPAAEHTVLARALRAVVALTEMLDGSDVPPSDAEIDAHGAAGGHWLTVQQRRPELAGDTPHPHVLTDPEDVRVYVRHVGTERLWPVVRWVALDHNGRPCARPKVTR